jgi:hypothetical protein
MITATVVHNMFPPIGGSSIRVRSHDDSLLAAPCE